MQELLGFGSLLLVAGNETTTNLLGNALSVLTEHPDVWDSAAGRSGSAARAAIEEVLRFRSPVQSMFRVARQPTELDGRAIPAGAFMVPGSARPTATRASSPIPEQFAVDRQPNRHIAFGHGIHFCLGAPLARARGPHRAQRDARPLLFGGVVPASPQLERLPSTIVYGLRHMPIRFEPV